MSSSGVLSVSLHGGSAFKCHDMIDPTLDQDYATKKYHDDNLADLGIGKESDTEVVIANDTEKEVTQPTYTKYKEVKIYNNLKEIRVQWDSRTAAAGRCNSRVYINGVAIGEEHYVEDDTPLTFYEIVSDLKYDDLIQIYGYQAGTTGYILNMKIKYIEFINQDP